jgi:eukaryotic-like serine/threonine-protein kinase
MSFFKVESWKDVLLHLVAIVGLTVLLGYLILNIWLPSYTNHGQKIEVPSLENLSIEEAEDLLDEKDLRLEIQDTTFKANYKPGVISRQEPKAGSFVKEDRRIYVTLNAFEIPKITISEKMLTELQNTNLATVSSKISQFGFEIGDTIYVTGKYPDYVLNTNFKGKALSVGTQVPRGSKLDIEVSDGKASSDEDSTAAETESKDE